ncbi:MAG: hypothetical protein ABJA67_16815 [Chthonomonadales bacterium]
MTVRVKLQINGKEIDQTFSGESPDAVVDQMRKTAAEQSPWLVRTAINRMTPVHFAQEAVKRFNAGTGGKHPIPDTCDAFLATGKSMGIVQVISN